VPGLFCLVRKVVLSPAADQAVSLEPGAGANGQGATKDEARASLAAAIQLILEDRREDALRGLPDDAIRETVSVG
jgi:predicted RNase H-like HicB family nuclease